MAMSSYLAQMEFGDDTPKAAGEAGSSAEEASQTAADEAAGLKRPAASFTTFKKPAAAAEITALLKRPAAAAAHLKRPAAASTENTAADGASDLERDRMKARRFDELWKAGALPAVVAKEYEEACTLTS